MAAEGHSSLEDLSASKDLHKTKKTELPTEAANQADLKSASLSSANVMRVPHRPELRRPELHRDISPDNRMDSGREVSQGKNTRGATKPDHGIITNPKFKYSAGFASRIISFLANILKVIERLILRLLAGPDRVASTPNQQTRSTTPNQREDNSPDLAEQEREKRRHAQTIARS